MGWADGDRIGANAEERRMTETDLACLAHENVQADGSERRHPDEGCDAEIVAGRENEGQNGDHDCQNGKRRKALIDKSTHAHTLSTARRPNSP
jgi:hypothetical protein